MLDQNFEILGVNYWKLFEMALFIPSCTFRELENTIFFRRKYWVLLEMLLACYKKAYFRRNSTNGTIYKLVRNYSQQKVASKKKSGQKRYNRIKVIKLQDAYSIISFYYKRASV